MDSSELDPTKRPSRDWAVLAFFAGWLGGLVHLCQAPLWRADAAVLRTWGDEVTLAGSTSRTLATLALDLPLGSQTVRLAWLGALNLGLCAFLVERLTRLALSGQKHRALSSWLALAAALSVPFGAHWMGEATTVAGGATTGAVLGLLGLWLVLSRSSPRTWRESVGFGVLFGLLLAEAPWTALALLLAALAAWPLPRRPELALGSLLSAALVTVVVWAPDLLRMTPQQMAHVEWIPQNAAWPPHSPLSWLSQAGLLWCAGLLAVVSVGRNQKAFLLPSLAFIALDWLVPAAALPHWTRTLEAHTSRDSLHLMAVASVAPLGAAGLSALLRYARELELPGRKVAGALLGVFAMAASIAGIEDAHRALTHTSTRAVDDFTDLALADLQPNSLVLTHSPELGRRLRAAQRQGHRPDVLVVPVARLAEARAVRAWLAAEPTLETLIRDLSASETPSERALNLLADARPVYVEADPRWDPRLLEHLAPGIPLSRFHPHALGRSDRAMALETATPVIGDIADACNLGVELSAATRAVLEQQVRQTAEVMKRIGDRGAMERLTQALEQNDQPATTPPASQPDA